MGMHQVAATSFTTQPRRAVRDAPAGCRRFHHVSSHRLECTGRLSQIPPLALITPVRMHLPAATSFTTHRHCAVRIAPAAVQKFQYCTSHRTMCAGSSHCDNALAHRAPTDATRPLSYSVGCARRMLAHRAPFMSRPPTGTNGS